MRGSSTCSLHTLPPARTGALDSFYWLRLAPAWQHELAHAAPRVLKQRAHFRGPRRFARREARRTLECILVREFVSGQIFRIAANRGIAARAHNAGHRDQSRQMLV